MSFNNHSAEDLVLPNVKLLIFLDHLFSRPPAAETLWLTSQCRWWWTLCGQCGASQPASMTTFIRAPWRRGSTLWRTSFPSTSLSSQASLQAWSFSWLTYYGENTDSEFDDPDDMRDFSFSVSPSITSVMTFRMSHTTLQLLRRTTNPLVLRPDWQLICYIVICPGCRDITA